MYRGKNQDYYISGEILSSILNRHGRGGIPRVSLKGLLWGSFPSRKGAWLNSFGVLKDIDDFT